MPPGTGDGGAVPSAHALKRSASTDALVQPKRLLRARALSLPCLGRPHQRLPPEIVRPLAWEERGSMLSLTGHFFDALSFASGPELSDNHGRAGPTSRIAVVGGGPAGLAAAIALLQQKCPEHPCGMRRLPSLALAVFEKRWEPVRRQHVFLDFGRLQGEASSVEALARMRPRLEALLAAHGASTAPGASLELRILEQCLRQLLLERARAASGRVAVRWQGRPFGGADLVSFDHVVGADGRRSAVRSLLMARIPRVLLTQCALAVEFSYNCHLEWQASEQVHVLKAHRYENWRPVLLYHRLHRREFPDYLDLDRADFEAVRRRFCDLCAQGKAPFTKPFGSARAFFDLFNGSPATQKSLRKILEGVAYFDPDHPALIAPVEQTLHRSPHLVSPPSGEPGAPGLWLLGDAAVGLPVSKGCNLAYHMAAAGRLATELPGGDPSAYEAFVFDAWHTEAWRDSRGRAPLPKPAPGCFGPRLAGRFTG